MGKSVGGKSPEVSRNTPTNNELFKTYFMGVELCRDMRTTKKLPKKADQIDCDFRGQKLTISYDIKIIIIY